MAPEQLVAFYRTNRPYRSAEAFTDRAAAARYYERYVAFVRAHVPGGAGLLEVGTGTGMSAIGLSEAGYRTTAVDVCNGFFAAAPAETAVRFIAGDVLNLPFASSSFDAVTSHQMLEHVGDPPSALAEMTRVLRPGGCLIVVGPNLIGLSTSLLAMLHSIPRTRPVRYWFRGQPGFPSYPFGTTYPEAIRILLRNAKLLIEKQLAREADFVGRQPDLTEPVGADSDSCYLLNPIDLVKYLQPRGFEIVCRRGQGPLGFLGPLAGGTWIAARKRPV